jgi:hypothetical protein
MERLFMAPFSETEPIQGQINQFKLTLQNLEAVGFMLAEMWVMGLLIVKLPDTYLMQKAILSSLPENKINLNDIIDQILADEAHHIRSSGEEVSTFFAKAAKRGKGKEHERDWDQDWDRDWDQDCSSKKCTHCDWRGHNTSECRKLKKDNKKKEKVVKEKATIAFTFKSRSSNSTAKAAIACISTDKIVRLFKASTTEPSLAGVKYIHASKTELQSNNLHNNWLVDSGASRIMTLRQEWFYQYIPLTKPIKVVLRDDSAIMATGVGHIFVCMHNGLYWSPAILQDILHVPDLYSNLLSVSHFNHCRNEICFANQRCELLDKSGAITCISHLQGSLYQMDIKVTKGKTTCLALTHSPLKAVTCPSLHQRHMQTSHMLT